MIEPVARALPTFTFDPGAGEVVKKLRAAGHEAWIVGGAVRDAVMGRKGGDVDLCTSAEPDAVMRLFPGAVPTGLAHGTVTVVRGGRHYEVTTFRTDGAYADGRHPDEVKFGATLEEDLARRDFTMNALAWNLEEKRLVDLFGGLADIRARRIRTIGSAKERFAEDALRMLRACRFAAQLGFTLDAETADAIRELAPTIRKVSAERIRDELVKIVKSPKPSAGLEAARHTGLLKEFLPELSACHGVSQNSFHRWDVYGHTLHVLDAFPHLKMAAPAVPTPEAEEGESGDDDAKVRLAGLFHDIAKPLVKKSVDAKNEPVFYNHEVVGARVAQQVMKRLKFSNEEIETVSHLVRHHMFHYTPDWTDGAVRRFIRAVGEKHLASLFRLREADRRGNGKREATCEEIEEFKRQIALIMAEDSAFAIKDLKIDGTTLMKELGLAPGRIIGEILHDLLEKCLDAPELNEGATLLALAKDYVEKRAAAAG